MLPYHYNECQYVRLGVKGNIGTVFEDLFDLIPVNLCTLYTSLILHVSHSLTKAYQFPP